MLICLLPAVSTLADEPLNRLDTLRLPRIELRAPVVPFAADAPLVTETSIDDARSFGVRGSRFLDTYLTPRLEQQMNVVAPAHPVLDHSTDMIDYVLYDELSATAERRARRGVKRAFQDYMIETTSLNSLIGSIKGKSGKTSAGGEVFGVGLGASHWLPEVELRYRKLNHSLRFRVGLHGSAGLTFQHQQMTRTRVFLGWDARDDALDLNIRLGF